MKILLVSDFSLQNFAGYLQKIAAPGATEVAIAPFGQVPQVLLGAEASLWEPRPDCAVVWTRPEAVLPSFQAVLEGKPAEASAVLQEVDDFCALLEKAAARTPVLFVPTWVLPPLHAGHGLADLATPLGPVRLLMAANLRLLEKIQATKGAFPLAAAKWTELAGAAAYSPRLWYGAKVPFANDVFKQAAKDVAAALRGIRGRARKLVLLDLDDTLWGGTVGETGWEGLQLGGHDPVGEALVDFQRELKALSRRGVALGILSKNEESVALGALRAHPEMVLRPDDFAGWRINWNDKARNLAELVRELNLGLDSVVFFDDNPVERARVRETFPDVLVPELPEDKRLYVQTLLGLDCFDKPLVTDEDRERARMYVEERKRTEIRNAAGSIEDWQASLKIVVTVSALDDGNRVRVAQLLNKTNQLNLRTRRLTEAELTQWAAAPGRKVWAFRVADRLGDSGLTGVLSIETDGDRAVIADYVLSCRVMGRGVEETLLRVAADWARQADLREIEAVHLPTAKNQPCLDFFRRSGWTERAPDTFAW
ncbi:MAG: HAD-IIIC family phosphatase, partial [Opitutaceae bacterium]|nr:HAD-IIIC family phosphatase [Opitutaceae bacterium]